LFRGHSEGKKFKKFGKLPVPVILKDNHLLGKVGKFEEKK